MDRKLRILFVMYYPGYMRYFDSAIRELARRGHHVDVAFDIPDKQPEGAEAVADLQGSVEVLGRMAARRDLWAVVARSIRGTVDYVRYLHPGFADAPFLRDRMRAALPPIFGWVGRREAASAATVRQLIRLYLACERAVPSSRVIEDYITARRPDLVLVTPLVMDQCPQVDVIKSAQALGIPAALCVASWDHLTTKGLIRLTPERVFVWNEEQKKEALEYHAVTSDRIVVTGAQPFDRWFERQASSRSRFCEKVGLDPDKAFVLFVGSTFSISSPEAELRFVRRWIDALRRHPALADIGILIRPHPYNAVHWSSVDLPDLPNVAVYPRSANPVNEADRQDYFDSLFHSAAVVGVNTTAMIEAAIVGRTVHSVLGEEFKDTQGGTLHFRYLLSENGGFLRVATTLTEHAQQIVQTLRSPDIGREACARFVRAFVRPNGIDVAATPVLVDALERLALSGRRDPRRVPWSLYPLRALLWVSGAVATYGTRKKRHKTVAVVRKRIIKLGRKAKRKALTRWWRRRKPDPVPQAAEAGAEQPARKAG
jgi:hypothetical protein